MSVGDFNDVRTWKYCHAAHSGLEVYVYDGQVDPFFLY